MKMPVPHAACSAPMYTPELLKPRHAESAAHPVANLEEWGGWER